MIVSQLAENKELKIIFGELFGFHGCEFYLKPVELYIKTGGDSKRGHGVVINPQKSQKMGFNRENRIIVLDEDF